MPKALVTFAAGYGTRYEMEVFDYIEIQTYDDLGITFACPDKTRHYNSRFLIRVELEETTNA